MTMQMTLLPYVGEGKISVLFDLTKVLTQDIRLGDENISVHQ